MVFHKVAIDVIAKGLDPRHPHNKLGKDGMLAVPSSNVTTKPVVALEEIKPDTTAVVSISSSEVPVEQTPVVEPVVEAKEKDESIEQPQQTTEPVVTKTVRRPPVRTPKAPRDNGSSSS